MAKLLLILGVSGVTKQIWLDKAYICLIKAYVGKREKKTKQKFIKKSQNLPSNETNRLMN